MTTCPNCKAVIADGAKFCETCGAQIPQAEITVTPAEFQTPIQPQQKTPIKFPTHLLKLGAIAVVAIIAVVVLCSLLFSGGENNFALYIKDNELFYTDVPNFNPFEVTPDYECGNDLIPHLSKDGSKLFYSDKESGSLYFRLVNKPKKDAEKIASDVTDYEINEEGTLVTYLKNGDLYQHNLKESTKLQSDVREFWTTENGKKILFVDNENTLYIKNGKKDAEKIKGEINYVYYVSSDLSKIYYAADGTLFYKKGNKDPQKIDSDVSRIFNIYDTGEVFYAKENEKETDENSDTDSSIKYEETTYSLYYFDGKDKKELTNEFSTYSSYDYALDEPVFMYSVTQESDEEDKEDKKIFYLVAEGETSEITTEDISSVSLSDDGKLALLLADTNDEGYGILYTAKIAGKKMKTPEKYDEDVRSAAFIGEDNSILCRKDYNDNDEYTLYLNKKMVDEDVYSARYNVETDTLIYFTEVNDEHIGTMKIFKGNKSTKISDDVYIRNLLITKEGNVLFLKDYNAEKEKGDLYILKGKKAKKLDEDVQNLPTYSPDYDYLRENKYDCRNTVSLPELDVELEIA